MSSLNNYLMGSSALVLSGTPICSEIQLFWKGEACVVEQVDSVRPCVGSSIRHRKPQELERKVHVENLAMCLRSKQEALSI